MILGVTGHRPQSLGGEYSMDGVYSQYISDQLEILIRKLHPEKCISGMALGVDMIFAITSLYLKVPVIAAIPFLGQESKWPRGSQMMYEQILSHPLVEKVIVSPGGYSSSKMQKRNIWIVEHCDILIGVWNGTDGGTANCLEYADNVGRETIIIDPELALKY